MLEHMVWVQIPLDAPEKWKDAAGLRRKSGLIPHSFGRMWAKGSSQGLLFVDVESHGEGRPSLEPARFTVDKTSSKSKVMRETPHAKKGSRGVGLLLEKWTSQEPIGFYWGLWDNLTKAALVEL